VDSEQPFLVFLVNELLMS